MHLGLAVAVPLAVILSLPLFTIIALDISFNFYIHNLPEIAEHPHVQDAVHEMRDASFVGLRVLVAPFFHASLVEASDRVILSLHSVASFQLCLFNELAHHAPTPTTISTIYSLSDAVDAAIAMDELLLFLGEDRLEVHGIGDVQTLPEIGHLSRALSDALFRILIHVELGVCRAVYTYDTVLYTLRTLEQSVLERYVRSTKGQALETLLNISSQATENSIQHICPEVEYALSAATNLLTILEKTLLTRGRLQTHCTKPVIAHLCAKLVMFFRGKAHLDAAIAELHLLQDTLEFRQGDFDFAIDGTASSTLSVDIFTTTVHHGLLADRLKMVQTARIAAGMVLGV